MQDFFEFVGLQWPLIAAFLATLIMLMVYQSRRAGAQVTPQQLSNLVNREDAVVVDLRDNAEFRKGHIVDALNIPYSGAIKRLSELEAYKDKPVVLVCKMGQHSGDIGRQLGALGFSRVYRLSGGMLDWQNNNMPLVKS